MTNGEAAMRKLLDVQNVDLRIKDIEIRAAAIPEKFEEWDKLVKDKRAELNALLSAVEDGKKTLRHLERQLEEKQEELTKYNAQLPLIKTNREYTAILLEIDSVEKDISNIEEAMLESMAKVDDVEARAAAEEQKVSQAKAEAHKEKEQLEQEQRRLEKSLKGTRSERDQLAADVEVSLLTQYDRIRIKKGGLAMARVDDESCDACHIQLPPQVVNEVIGGAVKICPSCNRLLYWMEP
jgi:hypothetical protein